VVVRFDHARHGRHARAAVLVDLLVDEAGQPHDARQVGDLWVAAVVPDQSPLQRLELRAVAVGYQPVAVPLPGRRLDDDVGLDVERIRQRRAVEVDEQRTDARDVARAAPSAVSRIDGDEYARAASVEVGEQVPARPERAVQDARELLVLALGVVVERLEREECRGRVERGEESFGVVAVGSRRRTRISSRAGRIFL